MAKCVGITAINIQKFFAVFLQDTAFFVILGAEGDKNE